MAKRMEMEFYMIKMVIILNLELLIQLKNKFICNFNYYKFF